MKILVIDDFLTALAAFAALAAVAIFACAVVRCDESNEQAQNQRPQSRPIESGV